MKFPSERLRTGYPFIYALEPYLRQLRSFIFHTGMRNIGGYPLGTGLGQYYDRPLAKDFADGIVSVIS